MDSSTFDTVARAIAQTGTRRRLVALLAALPLGGLLTELAWDKAAAERPIDRVHQRTQQRNQHQRNNNNKNKNGKNTNKNNKNTNDKNQKPDSGGQTCVPVDQLCAVASPIRCCGSTAFNNIGCYPTAYFPIGVCQDQCTDDVDDAGCQSRWGPDFACKQDFLSCTPPGQHCCRGKVCSGNPDCQGRGPCCPTLLGEKRCCAPGHVCATFGGCATPT